MRCDDIRELMSAHVDGALDGAGEQGLAAHLAACASCRQELADLQRLVQELQQMKPVAPPPDLTARIHAGLRSSHRSNILVFLNLPQTRVALAASLVIILTALGIRQMYGTRQLPAEEAALRQHAKIPALTAPAPVIRASDAPALANTPVSCAEAVGTEVTQAPEPVATRRPCVLTKQAEDKEVQMQEGGGGKSLAAEAPATTDAKPAKLRLYRDEAGEGLKGDALPAPKEMASVRAEDDKLRERASAELQARVEEKREEPPPRSRLALPADAHANEALDEAVAREVDDASQGYASKLPAGRAPGVSTPGARRTEKGARQQMDGKAVFAGKSALPDGYTFRTDRLREAADIVSRHDRKGVGGGKAGADREILSKRKDAAAEAPQQVVMEVTIPPAEVADLLEELRQAGAVLASAPASFYAQAVAGGPAPHGILFKKTAAADVLDTAPAATATAPGTPATNVLVRFMFVPPEP